MADIFREVDEDLRRERYTKLWKKYGWVAVVIAALIVLGTAGYRGYQFYTAQQATQAGDRFQTAQGLINADQRDDALFMLDALRNEAPAIYRDLADFQLAGLAEESLSPQERAAAFLRLAESSSLPRAARDLARLRAGYLVVDEAPYERVREILGPLDNANNAFRASAREVLALSAYRAGDGDRAMGYFTQIVSDSGAPSTVVARAEAYMAVISGHEVNVLTLPADAPRITQPSGTLLPSSSVGTGRGGLESILPQGQAPDLAPMLENLTVEDEVEPGVDLVDELLVDENEEVELEVEVEGETEEEIVR